MNWTIKWYPPFPVGSNKFCDGGVTLSKEGQLLRSILIETDTGSHSHTEIQDKYENYEKFLQHSRRKILFLVPNNKRIEHLQETLRKFSLPSIFPKSSESETER